MLVKGNQYKSRPVSERIVVNLLAVVLTMFYILSEIELILKYNGLFMCAISFVLSSVSIFLLLRALIDRLMQYLADDSVLISKTANKYKPRYVFVSVFVVLFAVWMITFLILYPGIFGVDSVENLEQAIGTRNMDVLFPFYMTLYLRLCWNTGIVLFGSGNAGVAIYALTQMFVLALVVSYMIYRLYKCNVKLPICLTVLLYFVLIPYHAQSSIMILKDTPYAIGTLLFMQLLWEYYVFGESQNKYKKIIKLIALISGGILMALSRANGFASLLFCMPFLLFVFYKKDRKIAGYILATFVMVLLVRGPVFDYIITQNNRNVIGEEAPVYDVRYEEVIAEDSSLEVQSKETVTAVSNASASYEASGVFIVTAQQLGRVVVDRELSAEEYERLSTVINVEEMKETYTPYVTTASNRQINNWDKKQYLSVWLEFGLKYPYSYFVAWRDQTSGYWDPIFYSGGVDLKFGDRNPEVYPDSIMPSKITDLYYKVNEMLATRVPVVTLLWCNGFMLWITFFAIALTAIKRNYFSMVFYTPLIGLWLTLLIANPCNGSFRYFYSFYLCLPLTLIIPFVRGHHERLEEK